ncbi:iron ABC transporter permease [Gordonia malaquae]|uniref:FecCD family ABC transporter permease n=1 Tax=Gordonia malaquae TaxID=410332 RepID=UPI0030FE8C6B
MLPRTGRVRGVAVVSVSAAALVLLILVGVALGARSISLADVGRILVHPGLTTYDAMVLWSERIPRTLLAALAGLALGAAGMIMQSVTLNPLADPGVLGVEAGASIAIVAGILLLDANGLNSYFWLALVGAAMTTAVVYVIGTRVPGAGTTVGLVLAGAAVAALLTAGVAVMTMRDEVLDASLRAWSVGQLTGRSGLLDDAWPIVLIGLVPVLFMGRTLNALGLGADTAAGLGVNVVRSQLACIAVAVVLCAAATAACGPIGFIGLLAAHLARTLVGADHRWSLPVAALLGGTLLILADVIGRVIAPGDGEIAVGLVTAGVGAVFFIWMARRKDLVTM